LGPRATPSHDDSFLNKICETAQRHNFTIYFETSGNANVWTSGSQSGRNLPLGSDFEEQEGEQNKVDDRGAKQQKGGENAQLLFSTLLL